jgi:hypothetical protein
MKSKPELELTEANVDPHDTCTARRDPNLKVMLKGPSIHQTLALRAEAHKPAVSRTHTGLSAMGWEP